MAGIHGKTPGQARPFMNRGRALLGQAGEYADENPARGAGHLHYMRIAFTEFLTATCTGCRCLRERRRGRRRLTRFPAQLRSPAPGQAAYLTNQVINARAAPVEAAWRDLDEAGQAAAAVPARIPLGTLAPDMVRLDAETMQITHAIRMAACNAETTLARALNGHYARAGDEAYALIREALTVSGISRRVPRDGTGD